MEERNISERESLQIIQQMIQTAKTEQKDDGRGWILWGWLLFLASTFSYLNMQFRWLADLFFFWNVFGLITIILLATGAVRKYFFKKKGKVKTYTAVLLDKLNTGFTISLLLIIFSINVGVPPTKGFGLLLGLYGFWMLIYGAVLSFKPSIIGAYATWVFALASLLVKSFEWTMLLHAAAVLCGYIIPGYLANKEFIKAGREAGKQRV